MKNYFFCRFVYSKSEYALESVSVSGPSVYTITLHNYIRLNWNFVHRIVSSIFRSSSKMRRIRQEMAELSKKLSLLTRPSLSGGTRMYLKKFLRIIHSTYKSTQFLTLIPNMILVLNQIVDFLQNIAWKRSQNAQKQYPETKLSRYASNDQLFRDFSNAWSCS